MQSLGATLWCFWQAGTAACTNRLKFNFFPSKTLTRQLIEPHNKLNIKSWARAHANLPSGARW